MDVAPEPNRVEPGSVLDCAVDAGFAPNMPPLGALAVVELNSPPLGADVAAVDPNSPPLGADAVVVLNRPVLGALVVGALKKEEPEEEVGLPKLKGAGVVVAIFPNNGGVEEDWVVLVVENKPGCA